MTMHLVGPWMTTTNTKKRKIKKTKRQLNADIEHDKWLRKMGVNVGVVSTASTAVSKTVSLDSNPSTNAIPLSNKIVPIEKKKGVDTRTKLRYSSRYVIGQAYNKGGIQVLSSNETKDPNTGKRR